MLFCFKDETRRLDFDSGAGKLHLDNTDMYFLGGIDGAASSLDEPLSEKNEYDNLDVSRHIEEAVRSSVN